MAWAGSSQAGVVTEPTYMYVKWNFQSAGANCNGAAARTGEIRSNASAPKSEPQSYQCCDQYGDQYSCTQFGGSRSGYPTSEACASGTPIPPQANFQITAYKAPGASTQSSPDLSSYNNGGDTYAYQVYMNPQTNVSSMQVLAGFTKVNGDGCGNISGYCYRNNYTNVNFDTSYAACDQWIKTTYNYCAFSTAEIWVKFKPTNGCPNATPAPPASTATPAPSVAPAPVCDLSVGGTGRSCTDSTECSKCNNVCGLAGNQPYFRSDTAASAIGVNYTNSSNGVVAQNAGPLKVCVPSTSVAASLQETKPPASVQANLDKTILGIDLAKNAYRCMLKDNDKHRVGGSGSNLCGCESGYSPFMAGQSEVIAQNSSLNQQRSKLDVIWAQIVELSADRPNAKNIQKLTQHIPSLISSASADSPAASLTYSDENPAVWKVAAQGYGSVGAPPAGKALVCARTCTDDAFRNPGDDANTCSCPSGKSFNATTWQCVTCPEGASIQPGETACTCPTGYDFWPAGAAPSAQKCRPIAGLEYQRSSDGYPICGPGRAPMGYNLTTPSFATSGRPNVASTVSYRNSNFPYATADAGGAPVYAYANYPHCGCVVSDIPEGGAANTPSKVTEADYYSSINPVDSIKGFPQNQSGPVAMTSLSTDDGRLSAKFVKCGCPNINEKMVKVGDVTTCVPMVDKTDPYMRFGVYNPSADDATNVISGGSSGVVNPGTGKEVTQILLPADSTSSSNVSYTRKIWKCDVGFILNGSGKCDLDLSKHMCAGDSPVSKDVSGANPAAQFANVRNKKLACCMNLFAKDAAPGTPVKFDCIENSKKVYKDFNELWASSDDASQGGQMNAFVLSNASGSPLTGYYTENGVRCGEYSEFSSEAIQPTRVNPVVAGGQMNRAQGAGADVVENIGSAIPNPTSSGFSFMVSKLGNAAKAPRTAAERRRCPILVRAALVVGCPENPQATNATVRTVADGIGRRCGVASSVQVKVRVEQIAEIAGQSKYEATDTILDSKSASSISIDRIIQKKYGNQCPSGTSRRGDACVY